MELEIAPMTVKDLEEVLEIEIDSFSFPWSRNSFYTEITGNGYSYYLVCRLKDSKKIIGYGGIWTLFDEAHITTLAVHSLYRQAGIGTLIITRLIKNSLQKGAQKVFLEVRDSNREARNLYEKLQFKVIGKRKNYYLDEDALVMMRDFIETETDIKGSVSLCPDNH
ncbi:MAG: ribosomal protein S18-alanine N-acetyltransferase [Bacillota bacterium]|nr:ribosomal protein S18-alanine N-acetyltransferase [Bacillota bacterium]